MKRRKPKAAKVDRVKERIPRFVPNCVSELGKWANALKHKNKIYPVRAAIYKRVREIQTIEIRFVVDGVRRAKDVEDLDAVFKSLQRLYGSYGRHLRAFDRALDSIMVPLREMAPQDAFSDGTMASEYLEGVHEYMAMTAVRKVLEEIEMLPRYPENAVYEIEKYGEFDLSSRRFDDWLEKALPYFIGKILEKKEEKK